jgi:hypothetical protein
MFAERSAACCQCQSHLGSVSCQCVSNHCNHVCCASGDLGLCHQLYQAPKLKRCDARPFCSKICGRSRVAYLRPLIYFSNLKFSCTPAVSAGTECTGRKCSLLEIALDSSVGLIRHSGLTGAFSFHTPPPASASRLRSHSNSHIDRPLLQHHRVANRFRQHLV